MVKISTVIELLVLCLLIAFAASRVIDPIDGARGLANDHHHGARGLVNGHHHKASFRKNRQEVEVPNRFCKCSSLSCNCCRDFSLPVVPIKGPGCAMIQYINDDKISITMSFGDRVLRNITVNGKSPKPVCMGLPGGISKFCGKVYGINREGDQFKACLGLELRALDDVEAALRVSCFRFGPQGLNLEPGQPVPVDEEEEDDDDEYGLGDDDDDDDDDDDFGLGDDDDDDDDATANDADNDVDSDESDYTGFSALSEEFLGDIFGSESGTKKKRKDPVQVISKPVITPTVNYVQQPTKVQNSKPVRTPVVPTTQGIRKPVRRPTTPTPLVVKKPVVPTIQTPTKPNKPVKKDPVTPTKPKNPVKEEPVTATAITITVEQDGQKIKETKKPQVVNDQLLQTAEVKPVKTQEITKPAVIASIKRPVAMSKPVIKVEQINKEPSKIQQNMNDKEDPSNKDQTVMSNPIIDVVKTESAEKINTQTSNKVESIPVKPNVVSEEIQSQSINKINTIAPVKTSNIEMSKPEVIQQTASNEKNQITAENEVEQVQITTEQSNLEITSAVEQESGEESANDENQTEKDNTEDVIGVITGDFESATQPSLSDEGTDKVETITENNNTNQDDSSSYEEDDEDGDDDIGVSILDDDEDDEDEEVDVSKQEDIKTESIKEDILPEIIKPEKKDTDDEEDEDDDDDLLDGILDDDDEEEEKDRKIEAPVQVNPLLYQLASISVGSTSQARHLPPLSPFYRSSRTHKRMRLPPIESTT